MSETLIKVQNLSKTFIVPHEKRTTLKSYFLNPFKKIEKETFHALTDINFEIKKGEFVGIIGRNGSGKSTLLQIIANIYEPDEGVVEVNGSLVPFLQLGVGFNQDLSGRENVYLNGTILGMTREFLDKRYDEIVEFAELEDFMDMQLKNYSSGMKVRLALAIAIQTKADIYLLDEVLAVGDEAFREKSLNKMQDLLTAGATVLYVSHGMDSVQAMCSRVLLLEGGELTYNGEVSEGINRYRLSLIDKRKSKNQFTPKGGKRNIEKITQKQSVDVDLLEFKILKAGVEIDELNYGDEFELVAKIKVNRDIDKPWMASNLTLVSRPGMNITGQKLDLVDPESKKHRVSAGDIIEFNFKDRVMFNELDAAFRIQFGDYREPKESEFNEEEREFIENVLFQKTKSIKILGKGEKNWGIVYNNGSCNFNISKKSK